jgi:hypothetical protein
MRGPKQRSRSSRAAPFRSIGTQPLSPTHLDVGVARPTVDRWAPSAAGDQRLTKPSSG